MKQFEGYLKKKLGDSYVLLAGGSHKSLGDFIGSISFDSETGKIQYTPIGGSVTDLITFGSNAFTSDSYLPLSGGTMSGLVTWNNTSGDKMYLFTPSGDTWASIGYKVGNGVHWATGALNTNNFYFWNSQSNHVMQIDPSGNVGIGTTSPSYKLHVTGDIYANGGWLRSSGSAGWYSESYGGGIYMTDSTWVRVYNDKKFYVNNTSSSALHTAGGLHTTRGIQNGNEHILSPRGGSYSSNSSSVTGYIIVRFPIALKYCMMSVWIDIFDYATDRSCTIHCGAYTYDNSFGHAPFSRCIGRQLRTRFCYDSSYYYIVVGESNTTWSYPKFMVRDMLVGYSQPVSSWLDKDLYCTISTSLPGTAYLSKYGYVISTDDSGNFTIPGNCYATHFYESSDARLKHDISPISKSIRLFRFNDDNKLYYGFIAQELETLHPELVDSSGEYKTVNYNSAICFTIAKLETRIKELESEIILLRKGG